MAEGPSATSGLGTPDCEDGGNNECIEPLITYERNPVQTLYSQ